MSEQNKVIAIKEVELSPELKQMMTLISNGLSLVRAVRKIRGEREVQLMPVGRPFPSNTP